MPFSHLCTLFVGFSHSRHLGKGLQLTSVACVVFSTLWPSCESGLFLWSVSTRSITWPSGAGRRREASDVSSSLRSHCNAEKQGKPLHTIHVEFYSGQLTDKAAGWMTQVVGTVRPYHTAILPSLLSPILCSLSPALRKRGAQWCSHRVVL